VWRRLPCRRPAQVRAAYKAGGRERRFEEKGLSLLQQTRLLFEYRKRISD
jgi:hypothetical protein